MKKIIIYIFLSLFIFTLSSCFNKQEKTVKIDNKNETIEEKNIITSESKRISSGGEVKTIKGINNNQTIYSENTLGENINIANSGKNETKSETKTLDF